MSRNVLDTETIIPAWVRALALIDEEAPTITEVRHAIPAADVRVVARLKAGGCIVSYLGVSSQGKTIERLRTTKVGKAKLQACLDVLTDFLTADEATDDDEETA